jgi:ankyrin repeat protein
LKNKAKVNAQDKKGFTPLHTICNHSQNPNLDIIKHLLKCEATVNAKENGNATQQTAFPYVDHYNVVSGSFPTTASESLLFQNENPIYGSTPTDSLYSKYWERYISLLYNPRTRLINCKGLIPLAKYFKIELNDLVTFKGNTYHLRAINNYDLKTGQCDIQLLGPIISDARAPN